jgi:hypothetical protein
VPEAAFSVLWLGAIGTGFAYLVFFRLLIGWGPTRASLVAYLLPVVAVILGVVVLGEQVDAFFLAGAVLIVAGVWVVNRRGAGGARPRAPDRLGGAADDMVVHEAGRLHERVQTVGPTKRKPRRLSPAHRATRRSRPAARPGRSPVDRRAPTPGGRQ